MSAAKGSYVAVRNSLEEVATCLKELGDDYLAKRARSLASAVQKQSSKAVAREMREEKRTARNAQRAEKKAEQLKKAFEALKKLGIDPNSILNEEK